MQSGELLVTGTDQAIIKLRKHPSDVEVCFKDDEHTVPCNHHHHDSLSWEVIEDEKHPNKFTLVIDWSVTNVREIKWTACY